MSGLGICLHSFLGPPLPPRTKARGPEPRGLHYLESGPGADWAWSMSAQFLGWRRDCYGCAQDENPQLFNQNTARDHCLRLAAQHDGTELSVAMALRPSMYWLCSLRALTCIKPIPRVGC